MKGYMTFLLVAILLMGASGLFAQSNLLIDELLLEDKAGFGKAMYLAFAAASAIPEEATVLNALAYLEGTGWGVRIKGADEPVELGDFSYVIIRSFDIPGGLFYRIFPGPRYAARELKYLGFLSGSYAVGRTLSGEQVLRILGNVLAWQGEG